MKTFEGKLVSKEIKVGIVVARLNEFITSKLLGGAIDGLLRHDVFCCQNAEHDRYACLKGDGGNAL